MLSLRALRSATLRNVPRQQFRLQSQSTYQSPTPPKKSAHSDFYKTFGRPLAKNFLIAVAVYQVLYYSWLKMESMEEKQEKEGEMRSLEGQLKGLTGRA